MFYYPYTPMCVSTVYLVLLPEFCEKITGIFNTRVGYIILWKSTPYANSKYKCGWPIHTASRKWGVVAEWIRALNSSSDASVQQSVGSNPRCDTCVPEQDT